jgi:hypothetical protein
MERNVHDWEIQYFYVTTYSNLLVIQVFSEL